MNPDETFIPRGVPYNPRRAIPMAEVVGSGAPPPAAPPPPPDATIILDETDHLGITTVIIHKQKAETDLGIRLKHVPFTGLVLDDFATDNASGASSILVSTKLFPTMNILSINGCDCSGMDIPEAMLMISLTVGELTIRAVHSQVLMWPGTTTTTPPTESEQIQALLTSAPPQDNNYNAITTTTTPENNNNNSMALVPANQSTNTPATAASPPRPKQQQPQQFPMVKAVIQKSSKRSSVGLTIGNEVAHGATTFPVITRIDPDGLCAPTALKVGMRIWSVNGLRCYNKDDTLTKLKRAKATCYIEAQQLTDDDDNEEDTNNNIQQQEGGGKGGRGIIRSMSPKRWLPNFHRNNKGGTTVDLVRAENGEST